MSIECDSFQTICWKSSWFLYNLITAPILAPSDRSVFEGRKSHRSICQFNFYNSHSISPKLLKRVKPYNSANPSPLDQHVFEGRRSHRSIALFTFHELRKLFLKSVENEIPYTTAHTRCQKKTSLGEANLIVLYRIPCFLHAFWTPGARTVAATRIRDFDRLPLPWSIFREGNPTSLKQ